MIYDDMLWALQKLLSLIVFSVLLLVPVGAQEVFAATLTIDLDAVMTVGSGSIVTINTADSNNLNNIGTLNVDSGAAINIGSDGSALLSNDGTINGPGQINLFGKVIEVENTGTITAIINEIFTDALAIGGEIIPIESTAVLLAGAQTTSSWLIPVIVSAVGISIVLVRRF